MIKTSPVMGEINDTTMDEDTVSTAISFTVTDINEQALTITYISSDESIISSTGITFSGSQVSTNGSSYIVSTTAVDTTVTLTVTPETNQSGTAFITITVTDPDGMTATDSFNLTVTSVENPPELSIIPDIGTAAGEISFTFVEADGDTVSLTVTSSDQSLILDSNIRIVGASGNSTSLTTISDVAQSVSIQLTQENNVHGLVTLTITASAVGASVTESFNVIVSPPGAGNALAFDGNNDYVETGWIPDLNYWTVETWVKGSSAPGTSSSTGPLYAYRNFLIIWDHLDSNFMRSACVNVSGTFYVASFGTLEANKWYHLAATYDGETLIAYKNGELITVNTTPSGPAASADGNTLKIGRHPTNSYTFDGIIDEVRIWSSVRTLEQIRSTMCQRLDGNETGLYIYYRFDHSSGTTLTDLTGNGYDGILTNMTDSDWITSGAALGDNSTYDYTGSVASDFSVTLSHSDGDAFTAFGDSGTHTGLHLYLVNEAPSSYTAPAGFSTLYTDHY
ncbi:hypothetical protein MHK_006613, partial [Candidatus Magnetomorum sp. HK-1]